MLLRSRCISSTTSLSLLFANFNAFSTLQYSFSSLYLSVTFFGCLRLLRNESLKYSPLSV